MSECEEHVKELRRCGKKEELIICSDCKRKDDEWCEYSLMQDAANDIEMLLSTNAWNDEAVKHLKGEVDRLKAMIPCWRSVNDPPKFSGKVFVWRDIVGDFYDREYTFDVAYYNGLAGGPIPKGAFFQPIPGKTEYIVLDDVTHWWRPEPPREEGMTWTSHH